MTIVRRIMGALLTGTRRDSGFEGYYSRLVGAGQDGVPSAREARLDLYDMRVHSLTYRYL